MMVNMMDNLALNVSSQNKLVSGFTANPRTDATTISNKPLFCPFKIPKRSGAIYKSKSSISTPRAINKLNDAKDCFARISSSSGQHSSSQAGSIMFWVGVGVALSPVFSSAASYLKKYAMTMIEKTDTQNNKSATATATATSPRAKQCKLTIVVPAGFEIEVTQANKSETSQGSSATSAVTVDVPPTKTKPIESNDDNESIKEPKKSGAKSNGVTVEALEKAIDDPTVLKMVYPNDMGGNPEWNNRVMDSFKDIDLDLNSPEVKEQFDQIGLNPEEVVSKIMANPEVAMAFQNPRVQAAIMDCSQNPMGIIKYQNDKEVMDLFDKISELFPGVTRAE
ncbi:putative Heat shock chaperonin-binding, STI1 domain-containing protein [Helianthus annuus]|uniref:Protein TIC 40, chloroplastic n=1 Tax=Helianthus annuus TaxID=4232 RepID=A0A251VEL7_HELAN|nr:protein TIC 40, chloroplastic [Helianthus annuus]KAF5817414.1 putative Heat shock chaperonin-binding protein [Helianthus annuus]KAJ0938815.1 putative Heat shock chaperonin-binding, STI1 domain-containing protein [Helianthus annuus]KAJ0950759.1 putative Heat shock chaperonin-binding, STI1 domain-containing protein [Helianthus annuus]